MKVWLNLLVLWLVFAGAQINSADAQQADLYQHKALLLAGEQHLFVSHVPSWQPPYNFQAFIEVSFDDAEVQNKIRLQLQSKKKFLVLLPDSLPEEKLRTGELFPANVKVYPSFELQNEESLITSSAAVLRTLFYRQIDQQEPSGYYSKYEKYYSVRSGGISYLFNRISSYRPFDHVVIAENQCTEYRDSLEVEMFKSKAQPVFSGSLESLREIAKKNNLSELQTLYLNKESLKLD